jgi:hypothetical protein
MHIKSKQVVGMNAGNVGWTELVFTFETGQKARFHTHSHATKCFNGIGRDITKTETGQKMIKAIEQFMDDEHNEVWKLQHHSV